MACGYCHNPDLVKGVYKKIPEEKIFKFLKSRIGLLDAVVLSGGECTLSKDLLDFTKYLKQLGFKIKIDTNGTNPELLEKLISEKTAVTDSHRKVDSFTIYTKTNSVWLVESFYFR